MTFGRFKIQSAENSPSAYPIPTIINDLRVIVDSGHTGLLISDSPQLTSDLITSGLTDVDVSIDDDRVIIRAELPYLMKPGAVVLALSRSFTRIGFTRKEGEGRPELTGDIRISSAEKPFIPTL